MGVGRPKGATPIPANIVIPEGFAICFGYPFVQVFLRLAAIQHFQKGDINRVVLDEQPIARQGDEIFLAVLSLGDEHVREGPGRCGGKASSLGSKLLKALRQRQGGVQFFGGHFAPFEHHAKTLLVHELNPFYQTPGRRRYLTFWRYSA